ncbi:MAG: hypothetical protein RL757_2625 [Bacteroidota bacterium]|jgi:MFS family permease
MKNQNQQINFTIAVASLGYFVDIYDIQLFNMISKASIRGGLKIVDPILVDQLDYQLFLWQMFGMLVGGVVWGIMGDKIGRKSVLFGSILIYSLANLLNAFVVTAEQYALLRFIAGFGLAGELGAAITLISETMSKEKRGYGTMIVVAAGALGAVVGAQVAKNFTWQTAYVIGGSLGLLLLLLRVSTFESGMFDKLKADKTVEKGNFLTLFQSPKRLITYFWCIMLGLPVWFVIGILIKFSDKIAQQVGVSGTIAVLDAVMFAYLGLAVGDFLCGWLSQIFRNRRKVVFGYLLASIFFSGVYLTVQGLSPSIYNFLCFILGTCTGYWALFATIASEQFGTNIRATVTTTVPNFVRGAVIPITLSYKFFEPTMGVIQSAAVVGAVCFGLAILAIWQLPETFGKDLDYYEN